MSNYVPYQTIADRYPIQPAPTQPTFVRWSKLKKFPAFFRAGSNRKSPPLWDEVEIEAWLETHFAPFFATKNNRNGNAKRTKK